MVADSMVADREIAPVILVANRRLSAEAVCRLDDVVRLDDSISRDDSGQLDDRVRLADIDGEGVDRRRPLYLIDLTPGEQLDAKKLHATRLRIDELIDRDAFQDEFLSFLDEWPSQRLSDGTSFDETFRHTTGDSLWWTHVASLRHPHTGPLVPPLRTVALLRNAIDRHHPHSICMNVNAGTLAAALSSLANHHQTVLHHLPESARPARHSAFSRWWWQLRSSGILLLLPFWIVIRAAYARLATGRTPSADHDNNAQTPSVVMSGWFPNHVRTDSNGKPSVWYWQRLADEFGRLPQPFTPRYLLHTTKFRFIGWRRLLRPFVTGWWQLGRLPSVLPLTQCTPALGAYFAATRSQWRLMRQLARLENVDSFRQSPQFAGADVSGIFLPVLREAVGNMAKWSRNVAATVAVLRCAGDVRVVLVHEEFYPKGMLTIAAARSLGLTTIGVQHGTIGPEHLVYMPPSGQIKGAPMPDFFAAYGDYARHIVSQRGRYPKERVRISGAPRFDDIITSHLSMTSQLSQSSARDKLNWSADETVILFTTESLTLSLPTYQGLMRVAVQHPDWRFVVKTHPHDRSPETYAVLANNAATGSENVYRDRLRELLAGCDVLVSGFSTTVLEAMLLNVPVVCTNFTSEPDRYPYIEAGVVQPARSAGELHKAIESALSEPVPADVLRRFLTEHLGPTVDGNASSTFAEWLSALDSTGA